MGELFGFNWHSFELQETRIAFLSFLHNVGYMRVETKILIDYYPEESPFCDNVYRENTVGTDVSGLNFMSIAFVLSRFNVILCSVLQSIPHSTTGCSTLPLNAILCSSCICSQQFLLTLFIQPIYSPRWVRASRSPICISHSTFILHPASYLMHISLSLKHHNSQ